jgi:chromosomal replication initiator protein
VLKKHGIGRISINPQTLEDEVLSAIGRKHSAGDIRAAYDLAPSADVIVEETAKFYDLDPKLLLGSSRKASIVLARQVSMYIVRSMTNMSLPEMGKFYGMHHTTVMHSVEKIETSLKTDKAMADLIKDIKANINSRTY